MKNIKECTYNAFSNEEKVNKIEYYFKQILNTLELDLSDDNLRDTPRRIAKMYVNEIFKGLDIESFPEVSTFENPYEYDQMVTVKNVTLYSYCAHHFVPFIGKANIAYYPNGKVIGLSKINRIVDFLAKKPQIQEKLTTEIGTTLTDILNTNDVGVVIEADHLCVSSRGINDTNSSTHTSYLSGKFREEGIKKEFYNSIK